MLYLHSQRHIHQTKVYTNIPPAVFGTISSLFNTSMLSRTKTFPLAEPLFFMCTLHITQPLSLVSEIGYRQTTSKILLSCSARSFQPPLLHRFATSILSLPPLCSSVSSFIVLHFLTPRVSKDIISICMSSIVVDLL